MRLSFLANERNDKTGKTNEPLEEEKIEEHVFESKSSRSSSSSSGYEYPLNHEVNIQENKPKMHPNVPKLNFGMKIDLKGESPKKAVAEPNT